MSFVAGVVCGQAPGRKQQAPRRPASTTKRPTTETDETTDECPEPNGYFADAYQCDKYYECIDGTITEKLCPDGMVFNDFSPMHEKCDLPFNIDCSQRPDRRKLWRHLRSLMHKDESRTYQKYSAPTLHQTAPANSMSLFHKMIPCAIKTNLMHYLSSVYLVKQPLHVSGIFVAHHQEVRCIYTTIGTCCALQLFVCCPVGQQTFN